MSPEAAPRRIVWVGHSTVLIELDGVRLLTDPVLRSRAAHLRRRAPLDHASIGDVDAVLVSHGHWDHLDLPSLARLGRSIPVVVPRGLGDLLRRRGFEQVVEVEEGDDVAVGVVHVHATHAEHDGSRGPLGSRAPALGYVVAGTGAVYFAGDTDLFPAMAEIGPIDLALLPVSGWGSRLPPGHLDARRAAEALALLRPRVAVPIHWGTLRVLWARAGRRPAPESAGEAFSRHAAELAPDVAIQVLPPGGELEF